MDTKDASALLEQHRRLTSRLARQIGRSEAEDLASEALTRGLRLPAPDGRQAPWIERIFRNLVVDRHRRARRASIVALQSSDAFGDTPGPFAATAEQALLERERCSAVAAEIPSMSVDLRDALFARFYEDRDYDELAATRGITATTARTRVHRALGKLRVAMARLRIVFPVPAFGTRSLATALLPVLLGVAVEIPRPPHAAAIATFTRAVVAPAGPVREKGNPPPVQRAVVVDESPARSGVPAQAPTVRTSHDNEPTAITRFNYEDDEIVGDLKRPAFDLLEGDPGPSRQPSLIEIPRSFVPAIAKMLEDI